MERTILEGRGLDVIEGSVATWQDRVAKAPESCERRLAFMTEDHHLVRTFVVRELPRVGEPILPGRIAKELNLTADRVRRVLEDLETHLFFLVRNEAGAVSWAFPVTVDRTPHRLTFSSGERLSGAWAEDAVATPFVQGRLRGERLEVDIGSKCACCQRPIELRIDSDMTWQAEQNPSLLVFEPQVDWSRFDEPSIVHAYWGNSVFFWSEEHARDFRSKGGQVDGTYLTLGQMAYSVPIEQGALFAFEWLEVVKHAPQPASRTGPGRLLIVGSGCSPCWR